MEEPIGVLEDVLLDEPNGGPQEDVEDVDDADEDEFEGHNVDFVDSEDEVDDGNFLYDSTTAERISVGLNTDPNMEEGHMNVMVEASGSESDCSFSPSPEELKTDTSSDEKDHVSYPAFNEEKELWSPKFEVGKTFRDVDQFRHAVKNHGVDTRCNLKLVTNDRNRVQAVCTKGCPWRIWASKNTVLDCFQVKTYNPNHNCIRDGTNRFCTAKYVAERYLETFRIDPDWKTKLIRQRVRDDLKVNIGRQTIWRARRWASILIEGTDDHQFGLLWSFAAELLRTNPGSACRIAVHDSKFQGIYVCEDACKKGFLAGCRQLIGLDGCFLKGSFGGQMLVAVALDANDCIYPVAYAIVEKENTISWRWFLRHLGHDLEIVNCDEWTFMTDRQKGLENVIREIYPNVEHRFCVRHMYTNFFKKDFKKLALKDILWRAAKSTTVADFRMWMKKMEKESVPPYKWLMEKDPKEWSKSHFLTKVKSDILINNLCECFNKVLLDDREKSIVTMLIDMHISTMKRIQMRRDKMKRVVGPLCPKIHEKLVKNRDIAEGSEVDWSGGSQWYVRSKDGEFVVDIPARTCTCRRWDLTGIPCGHACAAILEKRDQPSHYVDDCYTVSTYLRCYENLVMPLNGKNLWPHVNKPPLSPPGWKLTKRGRKQKKRRLQAEEVVLKQKNGTSKIKKTGTVTMKCSTCQLPGHNSRSHKRKDTPREDHPIDANSQNLNTETSTRLQPRRAPDLVLPRAPLDPLVEACQWQFMPTPGVNSSNASQSNITGPKASYVPEESFFVDHLIANLQQMERAEQARKRSRTARRRKPSSTN